MLRGLILSKKCCYSVKNSVRMITKAKFSTLGNPMFPQRAEPDIDSILDKAEKKTTKDKNAKATPDILSDHGGKIALVAFGLAIALFYSYYVGGQNKNKIEEEVTQLSNIEPYEMHEMRYLNNLTTEQYTEVVQQCKNHFTTGFCTYNEFVNFITSRDILKGKKLQRTHLLDRFLQSYIAQTVNASHSRSLDTQSRKALMFQPGYNLDRSEDSHAAEISFQEVPVSVDLLLVGLNMFMLEDANSRIEGLYRIAEINCSSGDSNNNSYNNENRSDFGAIANSSTANISDSSTVVAEENGQVITTESAVSLIRLLVETDQVPAEKQVVETGVKYPFKLYQRKDAQQMVDSYRAGVAEKKKVPQLGDKMSLLELQTLLLSSHVCAWAECYRPRP